MPLYFRLESTILLAHFADEGNLKKTNSRFEGLTVLRCQQEIIRGMQCIILAPECFLDRGRFRDWEIQFTANEFGGHTTQCHVHDTFLRSFV